MGMSAKGASGSGRMRCEACSQESYPHFGYDMYGGSDTGDGDGVNDPDTDISSFLAQANGDPNRLNQLGEHLYGQYWVAARRWRRFARRGTRLELFHNM